VVFAVLVASCSGGVYDSSDFKTITANARTPRASDAAPESAVDPTVVEPEAVAAATEGASPTESVAAAASPADATATAESPASPTSDAVADATPATETPQEPIPEAGGLLAFLRVAPPTPAVEAADKAVENTDGETATAEAVSKDEEIPVEDVPLDEVSEAELAGEQEADPARIAVPEEPIDDGLEHDFVNVYTSKPETVMPTIEGLPGVEWQSGVILVSRTPGDDDASALFGGDHPFARSVPGIPRQTVQAANGLLLAHSAINVSCVKPNLLNLVRRAESHFGRKVVVTSGYRSPSHNRRVRGATHSQHLYCNALDLYMPGVARDDLARFFFAQSDRGGIGLYCHTRSIHIDTGKRRQWRWSCRRRAG
jgi:hypothetical protein